MGKYAWNLSYIQQVKMIGYSSSDVVKRDTAKLQGYKIPFTIFSNVNYKSRFSNISSNLWFILKLSFSKLW